jgi:hypothetical protein
MVYIDGVYQIGGYFHLVRKERFPEGQALSLIDPHRLSMESLGQIKLGITTGTNLRNVVAQNPLTKSTMRSNSPMKKMEELA